MRRASSRSTATSGPPELTKSSHLEEDARRPGWSKLLREAPAAVRVVAAQLKPTVAAPGRGGGEAVLVLPAFLANDLPTSLLRRSLNAAGYRAFGWANGMNLGARPDTMERLKARLDAVLAAAGGPVAVIGWSLGGLYARELAKRRPDDVCLVITLGTPLSQGLRANNAWKLYEAINDHRVDDPPVRAKPEEKPPVRTITFWSRQDGIVAPASAHGEHGEADERIQLHCPHNEMVSGPEAIRAIVAVLNEHLARPQAG